MSVGFLFGAGFSRALHQQMPVTGDLLKELERLNAIPEFVPESVRCDLEKTLSYLWTNYPWFSDVEYLENKAAYIRLVHHIHNLLAEAEMVAWEDLACKYSEWSHTVNHSNFFIDVNKNLGWMADFTKVLATRDYVTVTMNYDTLLERLMLVSTDSDRITYMAPLQKYAKVWDQEDYPNHDLSGMDRVLEGGSGLPITPRLFKLHGSLSWYAVDPIDESSIIYANSIDREYVCKNARPLSSMELGTLTSVIVPPVADKSALYANRVLRAQWLGALNGLKQCEQLYCVGYSFPPSDLAMHLFLSRATRDIQEIIIVNRNADEAFWNRIKGIFPVGVKHRIVNGPNCVADMAKEVI